MSGIPVVLEYVISALTNNQWSCLLAWLVVLSTGLYFVSVGSQFCGKI